MKFSHERYEYRKPYLLSKHRWEVVGPVGAVHFHVSMPDKDNQQYAVSCGLEFHHTVESRHAHGFGNVAPHHLDCPLTGGQCWSHSTSLYAEETIWPMVKDMLTIGDHEAVFEVLRGEYEQHFEGEE